MFSLSQLKIEKNVYFIYLFFSFTVEEQASSYHILHDSNMKEQLTVIQVNAIC